MSNTIEDYFHYYRVCQNCGYGWWGLHCPHDGYQNNCGNCHTRPTTIMEDLCECEFVMNVNEVQDLVAEAHQAGFIECLVASLAELERRLNPDVLLNGTKISEIKRQLEEK